MPENLKPRQSAVRILSRVLNDQKTVDAAIFEEKDYTSYSDSDRHFIKLLILTALRRLGQIDIVLNKALQKPLPQKQQIILQILRLGLVQYLFLDIPAYAVLNTSVSLTRRFHRDGLSGLVNGVLRHITRLKNPLQSANDPAFNIPSWLFSSWKQAYSETVARQIAESVLTPPPLDISVLKDTEIWATRWHGIVLPTGSIRVPVTNPADLPGFKENAWVQNASAAIPAQLFTDIRGKRVADLCAAPGGKTLQLAARGAHVTAIDISENRLKKLMENIRRLHMEDSVDPLASDIMDLPEGNLFDAVLLDAPCSATGTLARHPELKYHRAADDIDRLSELQKKLLHKALALLKPGGELVFSTCSLQAPEGDSVIATALGKAIITPPAENFLKPHLTSFGSLRILPFDGFDGFYVCRLRKKI